MPTRFLAGVLLGAALIGAPTMVWVLAMQVTGTAAVMMGDQVERWTAQEIRRARPKGWRLLNHFALREGDMDHVLLGPAGAFVFETKWSGCDWTSAYGLAKQQTAVHQASVNARSLRPWDPLRRRGVPARPVVVLWGLGLADWDSSDRVRIIDGVAVVVGPELREWLASVITTAANDLESSALDAVYAAMEALGPHRSVRCLQNEGAPHQMDRSGLGVANRAGTGLTRDHSRTADQLVDIATTADRRARILRHVVSRLLGPRASRPPVGRRRGSRSGPVLRPAGWVQALRGPRLAYRAYCAPSVCVATRETRTSGAPSRAASAV